MWKLSHVKLLYWFYFILSRGESSCPRRKSCRKTNCHSRPATSANVSNLYIVESLSQFADSSLLGLLHILAFGCCYISLCTSHKIKTLFHIKRHFISYQQHSMWPLQRSARGGSLLSPVFSSSFGLQVYVCRKGKVSVVIMMFVVMGCAGLAAGSCALTMCRQCTLKATHVTKWGWPPIFSSIFSRKVRSVASPGRKHSSSYTRGQALIIQPCFSFLSEYIVCHSVRP